MTKGRARQALDGAQEVNEAERRMAAIHSEQSKLLAQKAALAPWLELGPAPRDPVYPPDYDPAGHPARQSSL